MEVYRLEKERFSELRNKTLIKMVPVLLVAFSAGIFMVTNSSLEGEIELIAFIPFLIILPVLIYATNKSLRTKYQNYELRIAENEITVSSSFTQGATISIEDISEIRENYNGSFTIVGKSKHHLIPIFAQVENRKELREKLNQIIPIEVKPQKNFYEKYFILYSLAIVFFMVLSVISKNKVIMTISSCITIGLFIWSFMRVKKSSIATSQIRKRSFWVFIVIISLIANAIIKLLE